MIVINPTDNNKLSFGKYKIKKNKLLHPTNTNLRVEFGMKKLNLMKIIKETAGERDVYLFGGAVRDCMLQKPINDLDFIINGDAVEFAKELKEKHGDIFKDTFLKPSVKRAVVYTDDMDIDFKPLSEDCKTVSGKDNIRKMLIKNIKNDDFSVNSMLIKLDKSKEGILKLKFIDYLKGKKDLAENKLKHNKKESFFEDPIKALRGIRLKFQYGMKINPETNKIMNETLKNPKVKKNKFYYRYARECFRIVKEFFKKIF